MGLRINTNIAALNASRTLQRSTSALNTSLERLSSGLRINRAKDDAAGLAIAEGFRSVVRGAQVAQRGRRWFRATAEGALGKRRTSCSVCANWRAGRERNESTANRSPGRE